MQFLRSVLFTSLLFVDTLLYGVVVLALSWLPTHQLYGVARSWSLTNLWLLEKLCGLKFTVQGRHNIPAGAHVAMWKHSSTWETIAQASIFPPQSWVLKRELMWIPLLGWAVHCLKPIAINRGAGASAVSQVLQQGQRRLSEGLWILIFPEGTRVAPGEIRRYGVSGSLLALKAGCQIVPVAHNAGAYWPRRGWLKRPGTIRVSIGPAINPAGRDAREVNEEVRAWIEGELAELTRAEATMIEVDASLRPQPEYD